MKNNNIVNVLNKLVQNTESYDGTKGFLGNENKDCTMDNVFQYLGKSLEGVDESALGLVLKARANLSMYIFVETVCKRYIRPAKILDCSLNKLQNGLLKQGQTITPEDFLYVMKNAHLDCLDGIIGNIGNEFKLTFAQAQEIFERDAKRSTESWYHLQGPYQCTDKILYLKQKGNLSNLKPEELNNLGGIGKKHIENEITKDKVEFVVGAFLITSFFGLLGFLCYLIGGVTPGSIAWGSIAVVLPFTLIGLTGIKDFIDRCKLGEDKLNAFKPPLTPIGLFYAVPANQLGGNAPAGQSVDRNNSSSNSNGEVPSQGCWW